LILPLTVAASCTQRQSLPSELGYAICPPGFFGGQLVPSIFPCLFFQMLPGAAQERRFPESFLHVPVVAWQFFFIALRAIAATIRRAISSGLRGGLRLVSMIVPGETAPHPFFDRPCFCNSHSAALDHIPISQATVPSAVFDSSPFVRDLRFWGFCAARSVDFFRGLCVCSRVLRHPFCVHPAPSLSLQLLWFRVTCSPPSCPLSPEFLFLSGRPFSLHAILDGFRCFFFFFEAGTPSQPARSWKARATLFPAHLFGPLAVCPIFPLYRVPHFSPTFLSFSALPVFPP